MTKDTTSVENAPPESFEQAMQELETLVQRMDQPDVGLDGLLSDYKRGAALVKYCRDRLQAVKEDMAEIDGQLQDPEGAN